jgi:hypothetical protein
MPGSTLFPGEKVYSEADIKRFQEMRYTDGVGVFVDVNGHRRYLSRTPPPANFDLRACSVPFSASGIDLIDKSNLDAAIDDQIERKARCSDHIDFEPFDQDGLPTCWAIGMAQSYSITRRCKGLPHKQMSGCSLAVPISGGHSGGYEGDSLRYSTDHGVCDTDTWPENNTSRSLISDPKVEANRKLHQTLRSIEMNSDQEWWSCLLRTLCGPFAYNWMSHVMAMCDFVRIESGRYGYRPRNSWGRWGSANARGFYGFNVYPMGHGTPNSGFILLDITPSEI